jgi:hypothetical protein
VQAGDTILIDAETYRGNASLAVWRADNLFIKGIGGQAKLIADGKYIHGKGIWVVKGRDNWIENIHFEGAAVPDKNGAGIRLDGIGITVRYCAFINNENGILTSNPEEGDIVIEFCEFDQGGHGDGFSHNLYVGRVQSLSFRFNYSHHAKIGHLLKSRARFNVIGYNRIMDETSGFSSRLLDLPNGGFSIIIGNLLMQGPDAENSTLIGYGLEGLTTAAPNELYVINNTCVNKRPNSGIFVDIEEGTEKAIIANNIFTGGGRVHRGETADIHHNLVLEDIDSVGFKDEVNYDYHLLSHSPAINYGTFIDPVMGISLMSINEYEHPMMQNARTILGEIDAGAYEYEGSTGSFQEELSTIKVYPNPVREQLFLDETNAYFKVYNAMGKVALQGKFNQVIKVGQLNAGIYFLHVTNGAGEEKIGQFIKK